MTTSSYEISNETWLGRGRLTTTIGDILLSFYFCSSVLVLFLLTTPEIRHWFILPVFICGVLIGTDAVRMLRGNGDLFEPVAFVSLVGFHFFFLAPLLHVRWDYWAIYLTPIDDWKYWAGRMAALNVVGLGFYLLARSIILRRRSSSRSTYWALNRRKFYAISTIALICTALLQMYVYFSFGGILGYISAYESREGAFENMGLIVALAENFTIIAMMTFVVWASENEKRRSWLVVGLAMVAFVVLRILFGGLRGSRGNTIWAVFWAAGLIHLWVRPLSKKLLLAGAGLALLFMYLYGFYKTLGTDAISAFMSGATLSELEEKTNRTTDVLILGDLGRTDMHALILARLSNTPEGNGYAYAWGQTYLGAISLVVPEWIWPSRPPTKSWWSTEIFYGPGSAASGGHISTRAHGIAGEGMLNFGPLVVPVVYGLFGVIVGATQRWWQGLSASDARLLIAPLVTVFSFYFLVWDSDNILVFTITKGLLPLIMILACSSISRSEHRIHMGLPR